MSSSPWAQWGALLLPRPDPRDFVRPRASSSSSVNLNPSPSTLRPSLSTKSLSATFVRKRAKKVPPAVPAIPPRLELLAFSTEPIVDLTLPPYKAPSSPPAARHTRRPCPLTGDEDVPLPYSGHVTSTHSAHQPHSPTPGGHSGRQRHNEFNYDCVADDASLNLMPSSTYPKPHDAHTDNNGEVPVYSPLKPDSYPTYSAHCTPHPSPRCPSPSRSPIYNSFASNNDPDTTCDAPLRRLHSQPATSTDFTPSKTSTHCPPVDEMHQNSKLISATDMLKFRRKASNLPSSAACPTITIPSIIQKLTRKRSSPPPIPVLTVTPPSDARASAPSDASTDVQQTAPITEADLQMVPTPCVPVPSAAAPASPFCNNNANTVSDAASNAPNDTTEDALSPKQSMQPNHDVSQARTSSSDCGQPQSEKGLQDSSVDSSSMSGPSEQGSNGSLCTRRQPECSEGLNVLGGDVDLHFPVNHLKSEHRATRDAHALACTDRRGLEQDEGGDDAKFQVSSLAERASAARLHRGHVGPRGLDTRSPKADAGSPGDADSAAGAACVTTASYQSATACVQETQALGCEPDRPGKKTALGHCLREGGSGTLSAEVAARPSFLDTPPEIIAMSKTRAQRRKQVAGANVLQKRRPVVSSSSSSASSSSVSAYSPVLPPSPLSQSSPLSASSTTTTPDAGQVDQSNTESTPHAGSSGESSSTMGTVQPATPTPWATQSRIQAQDQDQQSRGTESTLSKVASPSASSSSSSSECSATASPCSGKDSFGFLRWRRWSVGRGVSLARGEDGRAVRHRVMSQQDVSSQLDEVRKERWARVGEGNKSVETTAGPSATTTYARRPRTLSHGKLIKRRPAEVTIEEAATPRRPKFTLGNDSEPDLPSASSSTRGSTTHKIIRTVLTQEPLPRRPPLLLHNTYLDPERPSGPGRRRWTLASAMLDEEISDAGLIRELERMRAIGEWDKTQRRRREQEREDAEDAEKRGEEKAEGATRDDGSSIRSEQVWDVDMGLEIWDEREETPERMEALSTITNSAILDGGAPLVSSPTSVYSSSTFPMPVSGPSSSAWLAAQRALLTCRELLLTERRYLGQMQRLLNAQTIQPPPPLMLHYVAELVHASEAVLADMEKRPSVAGVADAFVQRQGLLEAAYVRWCGVVGGWFVTHSDNAGADERGGGSVEGHAAVKRRRTAGEVEPHTEVYQHGRPPVTPLMRTVSTWRKSMPSIPSRTLGLSVVGENGVDGAAYFQHGPGHENMSSRREDDAARTTSPTTVTRKPARKHTVRDLAILPTQRVMRYVLLYRDLLSHTPPSSASRPVVERAIEAACRIADKCNRAQGNAAFIVGNANNPAQEIGFSGVRSGSGASNSSRGSGRSRGVGTLSSSSRPSSPSTKTLESMSSASHSVITSSSTTASTAVTPATSLSCHSGLVDPVSITQTSPDRSIPPIPRTSMSAVSLSLKTSMGWGRGRASMPQPISGAWLPEGRNSTPRPAEAPPR